MKHEGQDVTEKLQDKDVSGKKESNEEETDERTTHDAQKDQLEDIANSQIMQTDKDEPLQEHKVTEKAVPADEGKERPEVKEELVDRGDVKQREEDDVGTEHIQKVTEGQKEQGMEELKKDDFKVENKDRTESELGDQEKASKDDDLKERVDEEEVAGEDVRIDTGDVEKEVERREGEQEEPVERKEEEVKEPKIPEDVEEKEEEEQEKVVEKEKEEKEKEETEGEDGDKEDEMSFFASFNEWKKKMLEEAQESYDREQGKN